MERTLIYISFSHADTYWHRRLRAVLDRDKRLNDLVWDDTKFIKGRNFWDQIDEHVPQARIMIMLVSPDYLAEDCGAWDHEYKPAIEANRRDQLPLLWIPVRESDWAKSELNGIVSATGGVAPLDSLDEDGQREAFESVYRSILAHLQLGPREFDVFLCHNSKDKPAVIDIAEQLKDRWLRPWLDQWEFRPGLSWQRALNEQIETIGAAAVFVGPDGMGPWQDMEQYAFIRKFVQRGCPVIPVILPGVVGDPKLDTLLEGMQCIDFRKTDPDPLDQLIWGITGHKPQPLPVQKAAPPRQQPPAVPAGRARPAMGGDSIGHYRGGTATLGCLVHDNESPANIYVLSDFFGLCSVTDDSHVGDAIVQPGHADGGQRVNDMIATLSKWSKVKDKKDLAAENVSAAMAKVLHPDSVSPEIRGIGMIKGVAEARPGTSVRLSGRSGTKSGRVVQLNAHDKIVGFPYSAIEGDPSHSGGDPAGFSIPFGGLILTTHMVDPGDGGAILVDDDNHALGMAVAGNDNESLFIPIQRVLDAFSVELVTDWPLT